MTTPTDPMEELQARVAFLEETIYTLASMLTGRIAQEDLPTTGRIPLSTHDTGRALTVFAEVISGDRSPNCPPWCRFGETGPTERPANWPEGEATESAD